MILHQKGQADLRRRAEKILSGQAEETKELATEDVQSLIHELRTHQIELEMQNEELRRAQIELEGSHNMYSYLYDFAPVGYFTFDKNGLIIEVNLTGASKLGVERQFLIKKPFSIYVVPDSRDMFYLHMREVLRSGSRQTCELKLVDKSGNQFYAQLESLAVQDSEGKPGMCRTAISDIMEHKRTEAELQKSEEQFRTSIENMLDAFGIYSAIRDQSGNIIDFKVEYVNAAACESNMMTMEEQMGKGLLELLPGHRKSRLFDEYCRVVETGKPLIKESLIYEDVYGGERRLQKAFDIRATKFGDGFVASWRDVTERMLAREALQRAHDELEIWVEERTAELARTNEELNAEVAERKRAEEKLQRTAHDLSERIKELNCLYAISDLEKQNIPLEDMLKHIVERVPPAYQYPEVTCARIVFEDKEFTTSNFKETTWNQRSDIVVSDEHAGYLEVFYLEEKSKSDEGPFLKEERDLVNVIVERLGKTIERRRAEEALQKAHDELEIRVQKRTAELEEANKKILERTSDLEETNIQLEAAVEERKRAEKTLLSSETKYRGLAESIGEVFYALDKDLRYIYWNNASEKLTGISAKDAIGKSPFELFPELKGSKAEKLYREVLKTQQPKRFVNKYQVNGKNFFFEINAYYSKFGISVIAKDITERKHAEDQIREQATLLDKAQDAIDLRDLEHRLIYWNKGAQRLYGWKAEEVIGKNADLLYKKESSKLIEAKSNVLKNGEWAGELSQVTKDGRELIVESRWTLMRNNKGAPKSILIINTDITDRKKLEAQFLRAQRMESIGTLAGGIAHDLNNVLTPVMLSIQLLNQKYTDEQSQKLLNILQKNTQRGADLIKQVLSFARGVEGERKTVQIEHLISEIGKVAKETFPRSIEIKTDVSKNLWNIIGDATQLHQVIMNMCVNARDAMADGGTLTISAENVLIDEIHARMHIDARVGSYIVINVSDTGTGIPPGIMDRIFDPFFTTKEQGKGTGLGLFTVLTIVKSHGGFIDVYSEAGIGTSFKVYLPAMAAAQNQEGNAPAPEFQSGHGEFILIVDDEASILDVTGAALQQNGYRVLTAGDGVEAISLYMQNWKEIKVVLMDIMMPVMDGPACIHALRKINPGVKIIGISGLAEKGKLEKNVNIHVQAFLTKPYTSEMLLKTISDVMSAK